MKWKIRWEKFKYELKWWLIENELQVVMAALGFTITTLFILLLRALGV